MNIEKLGRLRASIEGDTKELSAGIGDAKKKFKGFGSDMPKWVKPVGTAILAAGGIVTGALTKMIFDAGAYGDSLDKMSLRTGVTVEWLSKLGYAAKISGTDMNALETSFRFLSRRMDETREGIGVAKDQFDKLGISVTDATGEMRPSVDVMLEVADGLTGLKSESEKVALAMDVFGARSGPQLLPLLKQGSDGIRELTRAAEDMGLVVSTEAAAASAEFEDRLTDLKETAKKAGFEFAQTLLPAATDVMEKITGMVGWFNRMSDTEKKIIGWTTAVGTGLAVVGSSAALILPKLPLMFAGLQSLGRGFALLPALGPVGIGFAGVGAGIAVVAGAIALYKNAAKDVFFEEEFKRQQSNIEGFKRAIITHEKNLGRLKEAYITAKEGGIIPFERSVVLAKYGLQGMGSDVSKFIPVIEQLEDRIKETKIQLIEAKGGTREYAEATVEAAEKAEGLASATDTVTGALNTNIEKLEEGGRKYKDYYDFLSDQFSQWTSITGEGYKANSLQQVGWLNEVIATTEKGSNAYIGLSNLRDDLRSKDWTGFSAAQSAITGEYERATKERSIIDESVNADRLKGLDSAVRGRAESLSKESGMIKRFFDWGFIITQEAAEKVKALEKQKVDDLIAENERYFDMMIQGTVRYINVKEATDKKDYGILVRGNQAKLAADRELNAQRGKVLSFYMENVERQYKESFNIQTAFTDKTARQIERSYKAGIAAVESEYQQFKSVFEKINIDMIELDQWRADRMLAIEKALAAAKIKELEAVFQTYEEHVMETSKFWMTEEGFKIPLGTEREKSFSELAMFYGLSEAMGMREAEEARIPALAPVPPVAQEEPAGDPSRFWMTPEGYKIPMGREYIPKFNTTDLSGGLTQLGVELAKVEGHLGEVTNAEDKTNRALMNLADAERVTTDATAKLSDELAGHSLTSAFDEVQNSTREFAQGMWNNIHAITGMTDVSEEAARKIVILEQEKVDKQRAIFGDYVSGKIGFFKDAQNTMIATEIEYDRKVAEIRREREKAERESMLRQAAIRHQLTRMFEWGGPQIPLELEGPSMLTPVPTLPGGEPYTPSAIPSPTAMPTRQGDTYNINVNLENLYGGDEATMNDLAEDVARRIRGQNIQI